jgi:2-keto-4-pentenoate hydratase/2-oxohepta-3-ene-1,7-dioic acid hydratase in catechol pathway
MKLATIDVDGRASAAVGLTDGTIAPAADLVRGASESVLGIIEAGPPLWSRLADAARSRRGALAPERVRLLAPIPRPRRNAFCVGWNYAEHFAEDKGRIARGEELPDAPAFFSKNPATVIGPDAPVLHPTPHSEQLDWEVELVAVIGRAGRDLSEADALGHVFGYTIGNDVSVRDVQQKRHGGQWFKGKNFDTHLPLGPWIVSADELGDPQALRICSRVNGVTKQDSSTRNMVFSVARVLTELSAGLALEPGDLVLTGTPPGVGYARTPPEFLRAGDVMEMEIERIGTLRNRVELR